MSYSCWCGFSITNFVHDCAVCSIVARGITGWPNYEIPSGRDLEEMNEILNSGRGLTYEQRFSMLAESQTLDAKLPRAFRSQRGRPQSWDEEKSRRWDNLGEILSIHGNAGNLRLPLPGGSILSVHEQEGAIFIDKIRLPGPLPLLDIAIWLSNPARVSQISDWKLFLVAMSCCMRDCTPGAIENWSDWFRHNAWQGVEPHMFLQDGFSPESLRHPYLKWIRIIENEMYPDRYRRGIVDGNLEIINHQGGSTGKKWGEIVSGPGEGKSKILHQTTVPKLVVVNNRFCLLSLNQGRPSATPIVVDPRVWRLLVAWNFEPPESKLAQLLSRLFWCWNSDKEVWKPDSSQRKSIQFLKDTVESLGEFSSLVPEVASGNKALRIKAVSGMIYLILPTAHTMKYTVRAIPHESMIPEIDERGVSICIDSEASNLFPAGDVAVSYLLALHNDLNSQKQIFTIHHLLLRLNQYPNWQQRTHGNPNWWDELVEQYNPEEGHEENHEEQEEENWEEELFDEVDPYEEIERTHRQNVRRIIIDQLNDLPEHELREQFRQAIGNIFVQFGGVISELEERE